MALRTRLTEKLGIRHPVLLAPMGFVSGGALAAAVSAAGGLGLIGGTFGDPEWLEPEFAAAGNQRVGCGFIIWVLALRPEALDRALRCSPAAVMLSFGDAAPFIPPIKAAGAIAICQVQTLKQARTVLAQGADIIVAQGTEAGGHGGSRATLPLVPAIVDLVAASGRDVPVVAAGGIADGRGLAAALMLGADGVLMGTRFYAAAKSLALPAAKARVVTGGGDDTPAHHRLRHCARLRLAARIYRPGADQPFQRSLARPRGGARRGGRERAARYAAATALGDVDTAVLFPGEGIDLIHAVEPAGVIVERVVREAEAALARRFG